MDHAGCLHRPSQTVANVTQSLETMSKSGTHLNYCSSSVAVSLRHSEVFWGLKGVLETVVLRCWLAVTVEGGILQQAVRRCSLYSANPEAVEAEGNTGLW